MVLSTLIIETSEHIIKINHPSPGHNYKLCNPKLQTFTLNNHLQMEECHVPVQNTYTECNSKLGGPKQNEPTLHNGVCLLNQQD